MEIYWKPVNKIAWLLCILLAIIFFIHALMDDDGFLILDYINLPLHEAGHVFFSPFGYTMSIIGGTVMQLIIPLIILIYFITRGDAIGATFSGFWFGENFLYISMYMADARSMELPLLGGGEHDWNIIFNKIGILEYDVHIALLMKLTGWFIMVFTIIWFTYMSFRKDDEV